jgi:cytochrome P450
MIHRNEELYPDPLRYRPQRFIERKFAPHEFATFGGGHRYCLGAAFAMHEMTIAIGMIVREFDLSLLSDRPLKPVRRNATIAPESGVPTRVDSVRVKNAENSREAA